jgi:hypothetical protein
MKRKLLSSARCKFKFILLMVLGFLFADVSSSQTVATFGMENAPSNIASNFTNDGTRTIDNTVVRTGTSSVAYTASSTSTMKQAYLSPVYLPNNSTSYYIHYIVWAKSGGGASAQTYIRYNSSGATLPAGGSSFSADGTETTVNAGTWTRLTKGTGSTTGTSNRWYYPVIAAKGKVYFDDGVIYFTTTNIATDLTSPNAPTGLSGTYNGSNALLSWTTGGDAAGAEATGVQATLVLKYTGAGTPTAPTLNSQANYALNDVINTDWVVVKSDGGASGSSVDAGAIASTTTYALYHRDLAYNWSTGATTDVTVSLGGTPDIALASSNPAIASSSIGKGSAKNIIYKFSTAVTTAVATINQVSFSTAGTYAASDITKYQLWYKAADDFSTATQVGTDITTSLGTGSHSFASLTQNVGNGITGYFWITADIAVAAVSNNTINVSALTTADLTFASGNKTGTAFAGASQTFINSSNASDYFRTKASGNWNAVATWESSTDNLNWNDATLTPTDVANTITIRNTHIVTVTAGVSIDGTTIDAGGEVDISSGITLTVTNGTGTDLTVNGILKNTGTLTLTGTAQINSAGTYDHNQSNVIIPAFTWNSSSNLKITGTFTTASASSAATLSGTTYQNIEFACNLTNIDAYITLNGLTIAGTLTVTSTGNGALLATTGSAFTCASFSMAGGNFYVNRQAGGTRGLTVIGNASITGGTFYVKINPVTNQNTSVGQFTVGGDLSVGAGATISNGALGAQTPSTTAPQIIFNGTTDQALTILGTVSNPIDIIVNKASGQVVLGSSISCTGVLTMTAGQIALGSNNITLVSTSTNTASVASTTVPTPFIYGTGKFIVQRYIPGGKRAFRLLGHPFSNTLNLVSLLDNILITGQAGTGFTASGTANPSAFWYDSSGTENPTNDIGWKAFTTTDGSGVGTENQWKQYQGIRVLVRGNIADGLSPVTPSAVTIDANGTLNTGQQDIPVLKGTNTGFNFIGNPFASSINLTTVGGNVVLGGNLVTNFYVWDITGSPRGAWINAAFSSSYILPSFAGFIVKTSAADIVTIKEGAKTATAATGALFRNNNVKTEMVRLSITDNNINWDRFELYYNNESILAEDRHDGVKMRNSEVNFYSIANGKNYSIDSRPFVKDDIIPMGFTSTVLQTYTIKASEYSLPANVELYLKDKFLGTETRIEEGTEYNFSVTADPATQGNNRFELMQKQIMVLQPLTTKFAIKLSPNPAADMIKVNFSNEEKASTTITITNAEGKTVRTIDAGNVQDGQLSISIKALAKGSYFVTLNNGSGTKTEKLQIQ